jgi:hypothetical protein
VILAVAIAAMFILGSASAAQAEKSGASFKDNKVPVCTLSIDGVIESGGNEGKNGTATVSCTEGKVAGLGNEPVLFQATLPGGCVNSPGHEPPGHVQTDVIPIQPRGGHIDTPAFTLVVDCPSGLFLVVGDAVTYTITNLAGEIGFQADVPLT